MHAGSEPSFDALRGIKGKPVRPICSRKVWPMRILNLAVRAVGSVPTGRRALLLGITYWNTPWARTPHALNQPRHDVKLMKEYLLESGEWLESDITVLTDARGTPEHLLPTYANIMREITLLGESNCQSIFFLYTGHSDQRPQPKQPMPSPPVDKSLPGRRVIEEFDQFIIPIDAVVGPDLADINQDLVIVDDVLHDRLILTLLPRSRFLAILDTCHSATLFDLKHDLCNRTHTMKSLFRRSVRRVVVEPLWKVLGTVTDGGGDNANPFYKFFNSCNGLCPRQKELICPMAVTISACKDPQQVYESGRSLTETVVELLRSKPTATLADIIDSVLFNYRLQQKQMKRLEKRYKKEGNIKMMQEVHDMRVRAKETRPQIASSTALDLSRPYSWSGFAMRSDR